MAVYCRWVRRIADLVEFGWVHLLGVILGDGYRLVIRNTLAGDRVTTVAANLSRNVA